jgi:hypothetical protein
MLIIILSDEHFPREGQENGFLYPVVQELFVKFNEVLQAGYPFAVITIPVAQICLQSRELVRACITAFILREDSGLFQLTVSAYATYPFVHQHSWLLLYLPPIQTPAIIRITSVFFWITHCLILFILSALSIPILISFSHLSF